jgi:hypothetical protein
MLKRAIWTAILLLLALLVAASMEPIYTEIGCPKGNQDQYKYCATLDIARLILDWIGAFIKKHPHEITAAATLAIAAFTFTLWWTTWNLWKSSDEQIKVARTAAEAAKKSADTAEFALVALEGPFLFVVDVRDRIFPAPMADRMYPGSAAPPEVDIYLFNTGRSTAVIQEIRYEITLHERDPVAPVFTDKVITRGGVTVTAVNVKTLPLTVKFWRSLTAPELAAIRAKTLHVYVQGEITYSDTLGYENVYYFFTKFHPDIAGDCKFSAVGPHNYHTKKKRPEEESRVPSQ